MSQGGERWPYEGEAKPREMTPEQAEAYRKYMDERPEDPAERERLRRIFLIGGED